MNTGNKQISRLIREIDNMIADKHLLVFPQSNTASCVDGVWHSIDEGQRQMFAINLKLYCDLKNAFEGRDRCEDKMKIVVVTVTGKPLETLQFEVDRFRYLKLYDFDIEPFFQKKYE